MDIPIPSLFRPILSGRVAKPSVGAMYAELHCPTAHQHGGAARSGIFCWIFYYPASPWFHFGRPIDQNARYGW